MKTVFIVSAGVDYEGSSPIKGFATRDEADRFANSCYAYDSERPAWPGTDDADKVRDRKMAKQDRWAKKHPAGEDHSSSDYYNVAEIPFIKDSND